MVVPEATKTDPTKVEDGVSKYLVHTGRKIHHEKFGRDFVKAVIPFVHFEDPQWGGFPLELFDGEKYEAHKFMWNAIHEEYDKLMIAYEKQKAAKLKEKAKLQAAQIKKDAAAAKDLSESISNRKGSRSSARQSG